jgi:hypothetical protein
MTKTKPHICPECGGKIGIKEYLTLPGDYRVECPNCKTRLQPELNELHRFMPLTVFILIIITGINRRGGITKLLIYIGVMTFLAFLIFMTAGYLFIRLRKIEEESE